MEPSAAATTARLWLEPIVADHAESLFEVLSDPALYEYVDEPRPASVEALRVRYRFLEQRASPDGSEHWLNWAIRRIDDGSYVGVVQATVRVDHSAAIAYMLASSAWGHGYATEATEGMVLLLESDWAVSKLDATVDERNGRSIALLHRLGFVQVGRGAGRDLRFERDVPSLPACGRSGC